jgi:hypothetical protein
MASEYAKEYNTKIEKLVNKLFGTFHSVVSSFDFI